VSTAKPRSFRSDYILDADFEDGRHTPSKRPEPYILLRKNPVNDFLTAKECRDLAKWLNAAAAFMENDAIKGLMSDLSED
jgi:hypothetical protein